MPAVFALFTFFSSDGLRPPLSVSFSVAQLLSTVISTLVSGATVTRLFNHCSIRSTSTEYDPHPVSLTYAKAAKLWHIDGIHINPGQISIQAPFGIPHRLPQAIPSRYAPDLTPQGISAKAAADEDNKRLRHHEVG